jgi:ABC-2 type transport system permease protein
MATLVVVAVLSLVATLACLPLFSLTEVSVGRVIGATVGCMFLAAFHAAVAFLAASLGASRGLSVGLAIFVLVAGYVASFVLPLSDALTGARRWSPWYWSLGNQPVTDGVSPAWMTLVLALTVAMVVAGLVAIDRRDIKTA